MTDTPAPWPTQKLLDGQFLRQLGVVPHYFGLGFIQIKLDDTWRLHVWTPDWPTIPGAENELHNHRYEFHSQVLKGALRHELATLTPTNESPDQTLELISVSCKPGSSEAPISQGLRGVRQVGTFDVLAGGNYTLGPGTFHRSWPQGPTVTLLRRGPIVADEALVLREPGTAFHCPFSIGKSTEECWEKVEEILGPAFTPGYHLRPIAKGRLGETSKIQEELDELVEAQEQGIRIMAECELADLYGSIDAFLRCHYPHLSMDDLRDMAEVTRRAFESGRRT